MDVPDYVHYMARYAAMSDEELIKSFNTNVGRRYFNTHLGKQYRALRLEILQRDLDSSAIISNGSFSLRRKVFLLDRKIIIFEVN